MSTARAGDHAETEGPLGLFVALTQVSAADDEEYNAWYDTEGLPSRLRIDGILNGRRMDCLIGGPKYGAFYDLATPDVPEGAAYRAVSYEHYTPWTKRVHRKMTDLRRHRYVQRWPGRRVAPPQCAALYLVGLDFVPVVEADAVDWLGVTYLPALVALPGVTCARWFTCLDSGPRHLVLCHLEQASVVLSQPWQACPKPQNHFSGRVARLIENVYVEHVPVSAGESPVTRPAGGG